MEDQITTREAAPTWLWLLVVLSLTAGIFFRFANLDRKVYWLDETWTSLWLSGYRPGEARKEAFAGREIGIQELQKYQRINPERGLLDTVASLAKDDAQHPPLYYALARLWAQLFGDSVAVIRSLSALISLLAFPSLYWLCLELFDSRRTAWTASALMAVSPFHVLYAQEARQYSLWTVTILVSSAALLRAMRRQTKASWRAYAATLALGIYSHTLFGLVVIAHGAYVAANSPKPGGPTKFRLPREWRDYLLATLAGLATFAPWAFIIMIKLPHVYASTAWVLEGGGFLSALERWVRGFSSVFLDARYDLDSPFTYLARLPVLILAAYAILFLCRTTSQRISLFVLTLIGSTALALIVPDLIFGGRRSVPRFLIPCYLGIQLSVAHLLATQIVSPSLLQRKVWQAIMVALILGGVLSSAVSSQAETWWNKGRSHEFLQAAHIVNQAARPLLISPADGTNLGNVISLSYLLDPKIRFLGVVDPEMLWIPDGFIEIFLFNPSERLRQKLTEKSYTIEPAYIPGLLWRLKEASGDL